MVNASAAKVRSLAESYAARKCHAAAKPRFIEIDKRGIIKVELMQAGLTPEIWRAKKAVGFKVNNQRAVQFRKWAGQIVKDHTIQGWKKA